VNSDFCYGLNEQYSINSDHGQITLPYSLLFTTGFIFIWAQIWRTLLLLLGHGVDSDCSMICQQNLFYLIHNKYSLYI
jgi:hypothetical protein